MEQIWTVVFMIFPWLILGLFVWGIIREYRRIPSLDGFTDDEKAVLTRQVFALALGCPFLLLQGLLSFVTGKQSASPVVVLAVMSILGYISLTSITKRVSILRGKGQRIPTRGPLAVVQGIVVLVMLVVATGLLFIQSGLLEVFFP